MAPVTTITLICPEKPMEMIAIWQPLHVLKLPMACSATSAHFYLPPRYETPVLNVNISLDMANLQAVNISALHFCIWQHMGNNHSETQLQHLATIPSIPVHKVYQHLLNSSPMTSTFQYEAIRRYEYSMELVHPSRNIHFRIGLFCCYFFWCWPARLVCWPLQSGNTQYTTVDDNVEAAPIYRCKGKASKPVRIMAWL